MTPTIEVAACGYNILLVGDLSPQMPPHEPTVSYRVHTARRGTVRLWTMQPIEVWAALQRDQELYADEAGAGFGSHFRAAYDWMREQMRRRLPCYEGRYPWWAYDYKLDLRAYRYHGLPGSRNVRLELAVPEAQVLLSAYGAWHYVLSDAYLPYAADSEGYEREETAWHEELKNHGIDENAQPLPEPYQSRVVRSWERIFDVDDLRDTNTIQATFERLGLEDVVAVTEFTTQPSRSRRY